MKPTTTANFSKTFISSAAHSLIDVQNNTQLGGVSYLCCKTLLSDRKMMFGAASILRRSPRLRGKPSSC
jgi:hypothetical protein